MNKEAIKSEAYFASSNGYRGFESDYDDIYSPEKHTRVFVLKGGSGTGKSSLMKKIGREIGGACDKVTYYYCSSDPTSLDGIVCEHAGQSVAMLDGTAPHVRDAKIPGAFDETVDLAAFLSSEKLILHKNEIHALTERKGAAFRLGYRYLDCCGTLLGHAKALFSTVFLKEKAETTLKRITRQMRPTGDGIRTVLTDGIGMRGLAHFDTLEKRAKKVYLVDERYGFSTLFLAAAAELFSKMGLSFIRAKSPFSAVETVAIFFPDERILLIAEDYSKIDKNDAIFINSSRFIDKIAFRQVRGDVRNLRRLASELCLSCVSALGEAGEHHFALEGHYIDAMDFKGKEEYSKRLIERIRAILFPDSLS